MSRTVSPKRKTSSRRTQKRSSHKVDQQFWRGVSILGPTFTTPDSEFLNPRWWSQSEAGESIYARQAWVYSAVRAIAQNIACVPLKIQTGRQGNLKDIDEFSSGNELELFKLFERPNNFTTGFQLWELTTTFLNLQGMCFWLLNRSGPTEIPKEIFVFGKKGFQPLVNDAGGLLGWRYEVEGKEPVNLRFDQVAVFRFIDPENPMMGLAPLEAARRGILLDFFASNFTQGLFVNGAEPNGVISSEKVIPKKMRDEIRQEWEARHAGPLNVKKLGILWGGMKYQPIFVSHKDMEFLEQRKWTRDEILAVFKVPKSEISLYEDLNFANAMAQDRSFWQKTLIPIIKGLEAVLKTDLLIDLAPAVSKGLRITFDLSTVTALQESLSDKIQNAERMARNAWPINDINRRLDIGMKDVPWGDEAYGNSALATYTRIHEGTADGATKPFGETTPLEDVPMPDTGEESPETENSFLSRRANVRRALSRVNGFGFNSQARQLSAEMVDILKKYFWRLRSHQLARIVEHDGQEAVFALDDWNQKLRNRLSKFQEYSFKHVFLLNELLHTAIKAQLLEFDKVTCMRGVKELFNKVSNTKKLFKLASIEIQLARIGKLNERNSNGTTM